MLNYKQFERMLRCAHDITAVKSYMQKWIHLCCRLVWFNSSNNTNTLSIWKAWLELLQTFRFLLQQPLHYRQCCPTCTSTCWRRLPAHTFQPPCPANGQREDKAWPQTPDAGKQSSPVCQWPTREAKAASFQSFRVTINNRWNKSRADAVLFTSRSQDAEH